MPDLIGLNGEVLLEDSNFVPGGPGDGGDAPPEIQGTADADLGATETVSFDSSEERWLVGVLNEDLEVTATGVQEGARLWIGVTQPDSGGPFTLSVNGEAIEVPSDASALASVMIRWLDADTFRVESALPPGAAATPAAPVNTVAPVITPGTCDAGDVLTCSLGTWTGSPTPTRTRQWTADGVDISGETGSTYTTVDPDDVGAVIGCTVTATNTEGTVDEDSSNTVTPADPGGGGGGDFDPEADVTSGTLEGWYDPSVLADADGTAYTNQLANLSSAGAWDFVVDPLGGTAPTIKTNIFNGLRAIRCDGVNNALKALAGADRLDTNEATIFIVGCRRADSFGGALMNIFNSGQPEDYGSPTHAFVGAETGDGSVQQAYRAAALTEMAHPGTDVPFIYTTWWDGANNRAERSPGSVSDSNVDANAATAFAVDTLYIGRRYGAQAWRGDYGEMLVYSGELSAPDRAAVQAYLQDKWGIAA